MSTTAGVTVSLIVLGAAGFVPTLALVGGRWTVVPLSVLGGAVLSALATTGFLAIGGSLMGWFLALAVVAALVGGLRLSQRRGRSAASSERDDASGLVEAMPVTRDRLFRGTAAVVLVAAGIWCLRSLRTPMVGLDTRLFWFLRSGWWLWPQGQALANMHNIGADTHAGYPPLISSTVAVAWWVTGNQSDRIGTVLIAVVNLCAAVTAAWALVELGSVLTNRLRLRRRPEAGSGPGDAARSGRSVMGELPRWSGAAAAVLVVFTFFGVTSAFVTNGYADPLWSVAAVGAVAYLFLVPASGPGLGAAVILLAVAGETKVEGTATVIGIILVVGVRAVITARHQRPFLIRVAPTLLTGAGAIVVLLVWPVVMRARRVGADLNTSGPRESPVGERTQTTYDALAPHLHVILLAALLSLVGYFLLRRVRSALASPSDGWAWLVVVIGVAVLAGAYVVGPGTIFSLDLWLQTSAHRVTEFPALAAWWILAATVVVCSAAPATLLSSSGADSDPPGERSPGAPAGVGSGHG
jgi:hypothetical protein